MPISDKTRKILWGRSGNRCAVCQHELVLDATLRDDDSVVGEECHISSGKNQGPRYDPSFPVGRLDEPENLILLCRIHHKMVDDQYETYTVEVLQKLKVNHEKWVSSALTEEKRLPAVRLRRINENIPTHLVRLTSGRDLMTIVGDADAFSFEHDERSSEAEMELIGSFLQEAQDWGDLSSDLEAGDRVRAAFRMSTLLREMEQSGFWVFGGRETQRLEGEISSPAPSPVAILRIVRDTNPEIVRVGGDAKGTLGEQIEGEEKPDAEGGMSNEGMHPTAPKTGRRVMPQVVRPKGRRHGARGMCSSGGKIAVVPG